ncbi:protein of unknown function [Xenorhabdus poinarii G6]|uniref:Uncharacterized protein n=1 Tax=Xenorhabdus poinarii G6 TaxID=1354304 RepID=A0A068R114_9GAMM|nr:protein of unknown function [Xenorhabdus poinarii G6]
MLWQLLRDRFYATLVIWDREEALNGLNLQSRLRKSKILPVMLAALLISPLECLFPSLCRYLSLFTILNVKVCEKRST